MKKLITAAVLSMFCVAAFASDLSLSTGSRDSATVAPNNAATLSAAGFSSSPTGEMLETQSVRTKVEAGVAAMGSVFGGLMRGPVLMGKAFVTGFGEGYEAKSSAPATAVQPSNRPETQSSKEPNALTRLAQLSPTAMLSSLLKRSKDQQLAPVEEKSSIDVAPVR